MNPFADRIVPDPETRPKVTVTGYNQEAFDNLVQKILGGIRDATNHMQAAVLVSTEPGYGKTHLLSRLIDAILPWSFPVFVPPVNEPRSLGRPVNHRVATRLWRMSDQGRNVNQFEWLALQLLAKASESVPETARSWRSYPMEGIDHPDFQNYLHQHREALINLLCEHWQESIIRLRESPLAWASAFMDILSDDRPNETNAVEWIKGRHGLYPSLVSTEENSPPEDEAERACQRLFDLTGFFGLCRPVVYIFDQVENYLGFGAEALQSLFGLAEQLLSQNPRTQVVFAGNTGDWQTFVRQGLSPSFLDRCAPPQVLRPLTFEEARELRDLRAGEDLLEEARQRIPDEKIREFLGIRKSGQAAVSVSPRIFLSQCAALWDRPGDEPVTIKPAKDDFDVARELIRARELALREPLGFFTDNLRTFLVEVYGAEIVMQDGYEFWRTRDRIFFAEAGTNSRRWEAWARRASGLNSRVTALRPGKDLLEFEHLLYREVPGPRWVSFPFLQKMLGNGEIQKWGTEDMLKVIAACRVLDSATDLGTTRKAAARAIRAHYKGQWDRVFASATELERSADIRGGIVQMSVSKIVDLLTGSQQSLPSGTSLPMRERGILFHEIARRFVTNLIASGNPDVDPRRFLREFLDRENLWIKVQAYDTARPRIGDSLAALSERVAALREGAGQLQSWQELYVSTELTVHQVLGDYEGITILLTGRCDVLRRRKPGGAPEIVDYKLSSLGATAPENQIQLALYAKLLSQGGNPMLCPGTIEIYSPDFSEIRFSHDDLMKYFVSEIEPQLRKLARDSKAREPGLRRIAIQMAAEEAPPPQELASKIPALPTESSRTTAPGEPEDTVLAGRIEAAFAAYKLPVKVFRRTEAPQLVRFLLRPAEGVKVKSLANRSQDLQVSLELTAPPMISPGPGYVALDIAKVAPDTVWWHEVMQRPEIANHPSPVALPVGLGVDGRLLVADFADSNCAHGLIAGSPGSGKSEFLKAVLATLLTRNANQSAVQVTLVDPKILTFSAMEGSTRLARPVLTTLPETMEVLAESVVEMERRYELLRKEGLENLSQRFASGRQDLPFQVIIFDEFADLILAGREVKQEFENLVARLAAKGRAAGIHLLLATQRPDRQIVTGLIKANLPLKICFRVVNATNSQIVLDQPGAESLAGRGDLLWDSPLALVRAQSPYLTQQELHKVATGRSELPVH